MSKTAQKSVKTETARLRAGNAGRRKPAHASETRDQLLTLQRSLGNQGVGRLLQMSSNDAGVSIGAPNSQLEQQAERLTAQLAQPRPTEQVRNGGLPPLEMQKFSTAAPQ